MRIPHLLAGRPVRRIGAMGLLSLLALCLLVLPLLSSCGKDSTGPDDTGPTWDIDGRGIPRFVGTDYIDLAAIDRISRFRSAAGHDYTHDDHRERCRSMKHYFWPKGGDPGQAHFPAWTSIPIKSPVGGTVVRLMEEFAGTQVWIRSSSYPAFEFRIFHVFLSPSLDVGGAVSEGQVLGHHGGDETMSDIAVRVATPAGSRLVSYFDVMADTLFAGYQALGVGSRSQLIISREERDADPLTCSDETFTSTGHLADWVDLEAP
jgi:hypothetical protein